MITITPYTLRAEFDRRFNERRANVTLEQVFAALEPNKECFLALMRENDLVEAGLFIDSALRMMWSAEINREVEEWADEQANGPLVSPMQITETVNVPNREAWKQ